MGNNTVSKTDTQQAPDTKAPAGEQAPNTTTEAPKPEDAPADVSKLTLAEGFVLSPEQSTKVSETFTKLNLTQTQAQQLTDLQNEIMSTAAKDIAQQVLDNQIKTWNDMNTKWREEITAPVEKGGMGSLDDPNSPLSKGLDNLATIIDDQRFTPDPKAFREAMNTTGFGNNPAALRTMTMWAKALTESQSHVQGEPPKSGQRDAAKTIYPNLA